MAAVVEHGEAVQVYAVALQAFPDAQQAALAHGHIVCPHGDGGASVYLEREALFVVVDDQLVGRQSHGQQVVGDKLVEHVVLVGVVAVVHCIGIEALVDDPAFHVLGRDVGHGLAQGVAPELVGLGKEREAILAPVGALHVAEMAGRRVEDLLYHARLHEPLVHVVLDGAQRVGEMAGIQQAAHHAVAALGLLCHLVHQASQRFVHGVHHVADLVDVAVHGHDVAVLPRHGADAVDEEGVQVVVVVGDAHLAVGHGVERELLVVIGEFGGGEGAFLLRAVEDAVHHHDGPDGVALAVRVEGVPRGFGNHTLDDQRVQVELYGLVGGGKAGVVAIGGHELEHGGLRQVAHGLLFHQSHVFAELFVALQIAGDGVFGEHIARRSVYLLLAGGKGHQSHGKVFELS